MDTDRLAGLEDDFATALSAAIAEDAAAHGPTDGLLRLVLRWHDWAEPGYFTVHLLAADEVESATGDEAWAPLEWDNVDREIERTDRVRDGAAVQRAAEALTPLYEAQADAEMAAEEAGDPVQQQHPDLASRAVMETIRRLPDALDLAGVGRSPQFAATATTFEASGGRYVLRQFTAPELIETLRAAGELPWE